MGWVGVAAAAALIAVVLIDTFEVMVLPRRVRTDCGLAILTEAACADSKRNAQERGYRGHKHLCG